jgi:hypothetical protein
LQRNLLFYFQFEGADEPIGAIPLADGKISVESNVKGREHVFSIDVPTLKRKFFIQCESKDELQSWIASLRAATELQISGAFNIAHEINVTYE